MQLPAVIPSPHREIAVARQVARHRPYAMSNTLADELQSRAESAFAIVWRKLRASEISDVGYVATFTTRDAAVCAKALLDEHGVCKDLTVFASKGRWKVAGAWVPGSLVQGAA